ncbi:MAG: hypothetical protein P9E24_00275 [Candidatus Competibacter sp.]|nr:hypothetical protein [Candidatus Competibacter sp.]MDG4583283.1 hypothetical protein [Candidatus Competibacter sp.]
MTGSSGMVRVQTPATRVPHPFAARSMLLPGNGLVTRQIRASADKSSPAPPPRRGTGAFGIGDPAGRPGAADGLTAAQPDRLGSPVGRGRWMGDFPVSGRW